MSQSNFISTQNTRSWLSCVGFFLCLQPRCSVCKYGKKTKHFSLTDTDKTFDVQSLINCNSHHIVYVIPFTKCNICYISCTIRIFKIRIAEHLAAINKKHTYHSGAVSHFVLKHDGNVSSFINYGIEGVAKPNRGGSFSIGKPIGF